MLNGSIPILAYHFCLTNVEWLYTNIGISFLFDQCWMAVNQYWHTIFVRPTSDDSIPVLVYQFCMTNVGHGSIPILAYHFYLTNAGIYNTSPILVSHLLIPKIKQIYANEKHIISLHWNLTYFPVIYI